MSYGITLWTKNIIYHYRNAYRHKTYQSGDIRQGAVIYKSECPFHEAFIWRHGTN